MRNLARCRLAEGKPEKAAVLRRETIDLSSEIDDKHYANMAGLVLAESYLHKERRPNARIIFGLLKNRRDFRFLCAREYPADPRPWARLPKATRQLAVHHFNRSLTIFEAAEDIYHTGAAHFLIGQNLEASQSAGAIKHLSTAREIFTKLGIGKYVDAVAERIAS